MKNWVESKTSMYDLLRTFIEFVYAYIIGDSDF